MALPRRPWPASVRGQGRGRKRDAFARSSSKRSVTVPRSAYGADIMLAPAYVPTLKNAVSSAMRCLTSGFGMEPGVPTSPWKPTKFWSFTNRSLTGDSRKVRFTNFFGIRWIFLFFARKAMGFTKGAYSDIRNRSKNQAWRSENQKDTVFRN